MSERVNIEQVREVLERTRREIVSEGHRRWGNAIYTALQMADEIKRLRSEVAELERQLGKCSKCGSFNTTRGICNEEGCGHMDVVITGGNDGE